MSYIYMIYLGFPGVLRILEIPNLHYIDMNDSKDIVDLRVSQTSTREERLPISFHHSPVQNNCGRKGIYKLFFPILICECSKIYKKRLVWGDILHRLPYF